MTAGLFARVPAIAAFVVVAILATGTLTLAATTAPSTKPPAAPPTPAAPEYLVVPDVRKQAYVFAKGSLEQAGFAWKVAGAVQGYAANVVVSQTPAPGTRVVADGAPIISLGLSRNSSYAQDGIPENESPYAGTPVRLPGAKAPTREPAGAVAKPKPAATPAAPKPAAATPKPARAARKPAFTVAGAPQEPLDEIALPARAKRLAAWIEKNPKRSKQAVGHWLYQHNWIVTGAAFGWSGGAEALETLIAVDRRAQKLWGVGDRSEALARRTLAEVEARSR